VVGCCEHGNESSDSVKCWGNSQVAESLTASQEGFSSMESVRVLSTFFLSHKWIMHCINYSNLLPALDRMERQPVGNLCPHEPESRSHLCSVEPLHLPDIKTAIQNPAHSHTQRHTHSDLDKLINEGPESSHDTSTLLHTSACTSENYAERYG
jgi:hypothetical protein